MVARIYAGYKGVQALAKVAGWDPVDTLLRRQHRRSAELIYTTATRMQGLLIKACQFIGTRADVLPDEYIDVLSRLQDRVPPRPLGVIVGVIEEDLQRPLGSVFAEFDPAPLASASLAQVHRARLRDGREVAVKVQYPDIAELVAVDLANFRFFVNLLARLERTFDLRLIVREMSKYIPLELDFEHEAENARRIRTNLRHRTDIVVPEIVSAHTTKRVLVMEYLPGIKVTDVAALAAAGIDKQRIASILTEVYCQQILIDGFFHADPHPGNILVQPGPRLVLLDFGLAKDFPPGFSAGVVELTSAILADDAPRVAAAFRALGFRTRNGDGDSLVALGEAFLGRMAREGRAYADRDLVDEINRDLPPVLRANPIVEAPSDLLLVVRVMGLLSGIGKQLDSQVNPMAILTPFVGGQRFETGTKIGDRAIE